MTVDYSLIGARIKEARKELGLTQEMLAERLDVSVGYVSQVERGVTKISLDLLGEISGILCKDLAGFVSDTAPHTSGYLLGDLSEGLRQLNGQERRLVKALVDSLLEQKKI